MSSEAGLSTIEQLDAVNDDDCQTPRRPFLRGVNHEQHKAVFFRPRCKMWSCPACAPVNRGLWAVRAYHGAVCLETLTNPINFLTITSHEKLGPVASLAVLPHAWTLLNHRARRAAPEYQYLLVPEPHADGRVHIHAIENSGLGERWWKDNARECGFGFMAEEEELHSAAGAAYYVTKYISKGLGSAAWPKGFRRVRTSRRWPKTPELPNAEGWTFDRLPDSQQLDQAFHRLQGLGYEVRVMGSFEAWEFVAREGAPDE